MTTATSSNPFTSLTQAALPPTNSALTSASGTSGTTAATAAAAVSSAQNTFLTLLTTQLQNQDPLDPTNTDTFTQELISLSGVQEQVQSNNTLSSISTDLTSITQANGLGYVGKTVSATGETTPLQSGEAQWSYSLASNAASVSLSVLDSTGTQVFQTTGDTSAGLHSFSWNGVTSGGTTDTNGDFTLKVTAVDGNGNAVTTSTNLVGQVTGVDTSNGSTLLQVGDVSVPITNVVQINQS
jgi:flagellar basal-body rod modification protein FlgD